MSVSAVDKSSHVMAAAVTIICIIAGLLLSFIYDQNQAAVTGMNKSCQP